MARIDTDAPVRPRVRWGILASAAWAGVVTSPGSAAAAAPAMAVFSRNSRRETLSSCFRISSSCSRRFHAGGVKVLRHRLGVVRERDLRLLDLRVPLLLPLEAVVPLVSVLGQDGDLLVHRHLARAGEDVAPVFRFRGIPRRARV